jgi:hypothetical protein
LRHAGRRPGEEIFSTEEAATEQHIFCLQIALATQDLEMLEYLWGHYLAWDTPHLRMMIEIITEMRWGAALWSILKSFTADVIYSSATLNR